MVSVRARGKVCSFHHCVRLESLIQRCVLMKSKWYREFYFLTSSWLLSVILDQTVLSGLLPWLNSSQRIDKGCTLSCTHTMLIKSLSYQTSSHLLYTFPHPKKQKWFMLEWWKKRFSVMTFREQANNIIYSNSSASCSEPRKQFHLARSFPHQQVCSLFCSITL